MQYRENKCMWVRMPRNECNPAALNTGFPEGSVLWLVDCCQSTEPLIRN